MKLYPQTISNWGNYPKISAEIASPTDQHSVQRLVQEQEQLIARGNGRCYGDASLGSRVISTQHLNKFLHFDRENGIITCQSGVLLSEILDLIVPAGYFLPVTPGTKFITIGGAIAADVHGKNHHAEGCFSQYVLSVELIGESGNATACGPMVQADLFWATVGGMGSTGIITAATLKLKSIETAYIRQESIKSRNLREIMDNFETSGDWTYTVAWIDCLKKGKNMGRSILMRGEHAECGEISATQQATPLYLPSKRTLNIPFNFPQFVLNPASIKAFNFLYYHKQFRQKQEGIIDYDTFFYPLDSILNWNRMYGKKGFTQYQFVLPKAASFEGMQEILSLISESGQGSFLAVLKLFGAANPLAPHSFPREGYTLALDFPIRKGLAELLTKLDERVLAYGGRIYLAKDAFMSSKMFSQTYQSFPHSDKFVSIQRQRLTRERTPVQ